MVSLYNFGSRQPPFFTRPGAGFTQRICMACGHVLAMFSGCQRNMGHFPCLGARPKMQIFLAAFFQPFWRPLGRQVQNNIVPLCIKHAGRFLTACGGIAKKEMVVKTIKKITAAIFGYIKQTDKVLIALCLAASLFSLTLLFAMDNSFNSGKRDILVQGASLFIGLVGAFILSKIDYHTWVGLWKLYVPAVLAIMLLTFLIGYSPDPTVDDKAWLLIQIGSFRMSFQPAEILKIAFIMTFSLHLSHVHEHVNELPTVLLLCVHGAIPTLLVVLQGDDGTALVFLCIFVIMMFAAGLSLRYFAIAASAAIAASPILWFFVLNEDQKKRILVLFNPGSDPLGIEYQQTLGRISIGSGQLWGIGLFSGEHRHIPEIRNDMIFAFIGEALGFVGCIATLALIAFICVRILRDAQRAVDKMGFCLCVGVFAMIVSQTVINIGMCLGLLPVIGITLPFFSSGGSSVLSLYLGIGLVLSVYMRSNPNLFFN